MLRFLGNNVISKAQPCHFRQFTKQLTKQTSSKNTKSKIEVKTMKISHKISDHDLDIKVGQVSNWLKSKCDVKVMITADGTPGSKFKSEDILKSIQSKIPGSETKQMVKKASGVNFILRLQEDPNSKEERGNVKRSALSMEERSQKIRDQLLKEEFSGMIDELEGGKKK